MREGEGGGGGVDEIPKTYPHETQSVLQFRLMDSQDPDLHGHGQLNTCE